MWEYKTQCFACAVLTTTLNEWAQAEWEPFSILPYEQEINTLARVLVVFRRAKIETAPIPVKANEMYYIPLPEREKRY